MPEISPTPPLQVAIPKRAFETLNLERIRRRLLAMQSPRTRFESNEYHAGPGNVRITTIVLVASVIADELRIQGADAKRRGDSATLIACADAVEVIFKAMDHEKDAPLATRLGFP